MVETLNTQKKLKDIIKSNIEIDKGNNRSVTEKVICLQGKNQEEFIIYSINRSSMISFRFKFDISIKTIFFVEYFF